MARHAPISDTLKALRAGPSNAEPPTLTDVAAAAAARPEQLTTALRSLFYGMGDAFMRRPKSGELEQYAAFSAVWREAVNTEAADYYFGSLEVYQQAAAAGFADLHWGARDRAQEVVDALLASAPPIETVEGLAWRALLGQIQSIYDRDTAAATFLDVREHSAVDLVRSFYRDTGTLTYYSEREVTRRRRATPALDQLATWDSGVGIGASRAIAVSVDPSFYRTFAPTMLHAAQQLRDIDFVFIVCAKPEVAEVLHDDTNRYLSGLASLNGQAPPENVRMIAVDTPDWVSNQTTFFACSRFLALPGLLQEYDNVYTIDADLYLVRDPRPFLSRTASMPFGAPRTEGTLGVSPWRRYMAGNVVANRGLLGSEALHRLHDYLSVGLAEPASWMLDQNAIAYAVEGFHGYKPLTTARPTVTSQFMGVWEKNFQAARM